MPRIIELKHTSHQIPSFAPNPIHSDPQSQYGVIPCYSVPSQTYSSCPHGSTAVLLATDIHPLHHSTVEWSIHGQPSQCRHAWSWWSTWWYSVAVAWQTSWAWNFVPAPPLTYSSQALSCIDLTVMMLSSYDLIFVVLDHYIVSVLIICHMSRQTEFGIV